jgi:hypothetical protein
MRSLSSITCWLVGCVTLAGGCAGSEFTVVVGPDGATGEDGGVADAADGASKPDVNTNEVGVPPIDGPPPMVAVACGGTQCSGDTPVCCASSQPTSCAHVDCGCGTQLECSRDADCAGLTRVCCIDLRMDAPCPAGHFVARCAVACVNGSMQLCNPALLRPTCLNGSCSSDSGDLSNVGLPAAAGFGVCK